MPESERPCLRTEAVMKQQDQWYDRNLFHIDGLMLET